MICGDGRVIHVIAVAGQNRHLSVVVQSRPKNGASRQSQSWAKQGTTAREKAAEAVASPIGDGSLYLIQYRHFHFTPKAGTNSGIPRSLSSTPFCYIRLVDGGIPPLTLQPS